jgi:gamma-glutamyltranspeptidase/glutathione hydrolase
MRDRECGKRAGLRRRAALALIGLCLAMPVTAQQLAPQPESASRVGAARGPVVASRMMAAAANPLAAAAGREILRQGGSAIDAAIAIQMVLNLVEPQSSGIGGGAFILHYDATTRQITTYDGRETAPAAIKPEHFIGADGKPLPFDQASIGGQAVGVPGLLRMLEMAHKDHGRLPWARNFEPAIQMSIDGFRVSPRLNQLVTETPQLREHAATAKYFYDAQGQPRAIDSLLANEEFAETLRRIANRGADAFYTGSIARDMVAAVQSIGARPGSMTLDDLAVYRAVKREAVCGAYRVYRICGMGPPSSGGVAVLQTLALLEPFDLKALGAGTAESIHLITEATRLAFADRNRFLGDADHVPVPVAGLLDRAYLAERGRDLRLDQRMPSVAPGNPRHAQLRRFPISHDTSREIPATSHVSVIDASGNAVAMTTTIENAFGSRVFVRGFLLNNQLTDFAFVPKDGDRDVANAVAPGKRPRSSMSPTIVVDAGGELVATIGSPGGARIIPYVIQTLIATLDWELDIQAAIAMPRHVTLGGSLEIERGSTLLNIAPKLRALGHNVVENALASGLQGIVRRRVGDNTQLIGGADPRREGEAFGD